MECGGTSKLVGNSSLAHTDTATRDVVLRVIDHKGIEHKGRVLCKIRSGKCRDRTCVKKTYTGYRLGRRVVPKHAELFSTRHDIL